MNSLNIQSLEKNSISSSNWNLSKYKQDNLMAFITFGAKPLETEMGSEFIYSVIVTDEDYVELSEECFCDLEKALESINFRFSHWQFEELGKKVGSGCDSCAAH
jgi:hypothetical protein